MKPELFIIPPGIWREAASDEVKATCDALRELGIYHLPHERVAVRLPARDVVHVTAADPSEVDEMGRPRTENLWMDVIFSEKPGDITVYGYNDISNAYLDITDKITIRAAVPKELATTIEQWMHNARVTNGEGLRKQTSDFLVALLATRNVTKRRTEDKLAKLGIGKRNAKHRYRYTTTISLPRPEDMPNDPDHPPIGGGPRAPHLRRGHIRRQHFGPRGSYVKKIWIEPVFVNADHDFVSTREHYNVTLPTLQPAEA